MNKENIMYLTSPSAVALWNEELCGQISDGYFENIEPHNHWKFWSSTLAAVSDTRNTVVIYNKHPIIFNHYDFSPLYNIVGERMLKIGQMAKALQKMNLADCLIYNKYLYDFAQGYSWSEKPNEAIEKSFNQTTYSQKELEQDIELIKSVMIKV